MNTLTSIVKSLMFAAIALFFGALTYGTYVGINAVKITQTKLNTLLDNSNAALVEINKPKTGIIAQTYDVVRDTRLTLDNANKAAIDERLFLEKQQPLEMEKLNAVVDSTNMLLVSTNDSVGAISVHTDTVLNSVNQDAIALHSTLDEATGTLHSANTLVADKSIPKTLDNIQQTTAATAAMAKDTQTAWHKFLHPTILQKVWNGVTGAGISIAKFFW